MANNKGKNLTPDELRNSFLNFMERSGSAIVPSSSLLPENDPSTLFTGSGMQPMVPYLLGEKHPSGNDITNVQKCVRTGDIDETGDTSHLTFFEMMGRWEFGGNPADYKKKQIDLMWEWQINELGLDPQHIYISVYQGNKKLGIEQDNEAIEIWSEKFKSVGIDPIVEEDGWTNGCSKGGRIYLYDEGENWWSRSGKPNNMPIGEPGGPDSEMFFDFDPNGDTKEHPASDGERFLEIGNNVFMSYKKTEEGFIPLEKPNIDYGGGLERLGAALNQDPDVYNTAFFRTAKEKLENLSGKTYKGNERSFRIVLDHARASTFLIADGAAPANVDAGYITRRLIRRAIREARKLGVETRFLTQLADIYISEATAYEEMFARKDAIVSLVEKEEKQFQQTISKGEKEIGKHLRREGKVTGADAFRFYETYGFPLELTEEFLKENDAEMLEKETYKTAADAHAELSRTAAAGKFKGGLANHSEKTTALHSTAHLMLAGLRKVLGDHVHQKGSNITAERVRFDFSHGAKMTDDEKQQVEEYVNDALTSLAKVSVEEVNKEEARSRGVEGSFWEKYPDTVKVYTMQDTSGTVWSAELCGGPHVDNLADISKFGKFKIKKEQSSAAGVRRIKAVIIDN